MKVHASLLGQTRPVRAQPRTIRPLALALLTVTVAPTSLARAEVNTQLNNIVRPDNGPTWQLRVQVQFMFPK